MADALDTETFGPFSKVNQTQVCIKYVLLTIGNVTPTNKRNPTSLGELKHCIQAVFRKPKMVSIECTYTSAYMYGLGVEGEPSLDTVSNLSSKGRALCHFFLL